MPTIHHETLASGLQLVIEPMAGVKSLALSVLLPAGAAFEPEDQLGVCAVLTEMLNRGAGGLSAREHSDALDQLGVQRDIDNDSRHISLRASMLADKAADALPLLLDMIVRPNLDDAAFEPARDLCVQSINSMLDEPQHRVSELLRLQHQPAPYGRSSLGDRDCLLKLTNADVRSFAQNTLRPGRAILSLAGDIDPARARAMLEKSLDGWAGVGPEWPEPTPAARGYMPVVSDGAQVHIALAYDAPPEGDERSVLQHTAAAVLSGGMSGRLFTEVREKRGLCYAVVARYAGQRNWGTVTGYAGTTPERAQETLDVFTGELRRLSEGVDESEFERAIVGMKSRLVMQGESSGARAAAIASDVAILDQPRSLDELTQRVDSVTLDALNHYVKANPPGDITLVTLGPEALTPAPGSTPGS